MAKIEYNPDACIACNTCVAQCPVAAVNPDFPGPRITGPASQRFRIMGNIDEETLHFCANCKNCDISCPHNVPISAFNMIARAAVTKQSPFSLRDWMLSHGALLGRKLALIPAALRNVGMLNPLTRRLLDMLGIAAAAPLPKFAAQTFKQRMRTYPQPPSQRQVVLFPGCYIDLYDPQTGLDLVWLLNKAGYEVLVPNDFDCCGLPMIANGFMEDARANARTNWAEVSAWCAKGIPVLTACPSCNLMFNRDLGEYFPEIATGTAALRDAQEFVLECVERGELALPAPDPQAQAMLYHAPCHLRAQGLGLPGLRLLQAVYGNAVSNADAGCCGISGSYGFKKENYAIAQAIGTPLFETITKSGVALTTSECGTCRVQIKHGTGKPCLHPLTLVRRRLERTQA